MESLLKLLNEKFYELQSILIDGKSYNDTYKATVKKVRDKILELIDTLRENEV